MVGTSESVGSAVAVASCVYERSRDFVADTDKVTVTCLVYDTKVVFVSPLRVFEILRLCVPIFTQRSSSTKCDTLALHTHVQSPPLSMTESAVFGT